MQVFSNKSKRRLLLSAALLSSLYACMQKGFVTSEKPKSANPAITLEPSTKANDRPTESGTGVPGYLVGCSLFTVQDQNVQVGCNLSDADGNKIPTAATAWTQYDIRLPAAAPAGVTVAKAIASTPEVWDVNFNFKGADKTVLSDMARASSYGYAYVNASGQTVRIETAPAPALAPVTTPTIPSPNTPPSCVGGTLVDGTCFIPVDVSCTDYCSKANLQVHPYVIDRFGASRNADTDANKAACDALFTQIRGTQDYRFSDVHSLHGWGCYQEPSGRVVYDKTDTNPAEYPRIGDRRICGCQ